jgi:predicted alpha-1,6-mannanase (GH76 family)
MAGLWIGRVSAQTPEEYHRRADAALQSFLLKYWSQGHNYLRANYPDNGAETGYWTFAQGFDALLDGVERTGGRRYAGLVETFHDAQDARGWLAGFYDDECWMALALMRAHDLTGESRYLARAEDLFADIMLAWDTTCCGTPRGGLWWDKRHTQKATASNAGAVIAGARLSERTGTTSYLDFAERAYAFWFANMVDHTRQHVLDHILPDGTKVDWQFTYNEGLMIGAAVELHRLTGEAHYLGEARAIAGFVARSETVSSSFGSVLTDGSNSSCTGDCRAFKGPAYRYLKLLYTAAADATYRGILRGSANALWNLARAPGDDLFSVSWTGPVMTSFSEEQEAAAVMALNLYPELEGPYPGTGASAGQYEAEDAAIRGVGLEAAHAGFTGWGYVAGWNGAGQRVAFQVRAPATARYNLIFRHAGGAGDAVRRLAIDGAIVASQLRFPGTGSWDAYASISLEQLLTAGAHRISLDHDAASGSSNYLNLDHLLLEPVLPFFINGDFNRDAIVDVSDAVAILFFLFRDGQASDCEAPADVDGDGAANVSDVVYLLRYLFREESPPAAPFPECGPLPPGSNARCEEFAPCE